MTLVQQIERAADLVAGARYAVALTGAGISTPSGIPDFRSPGSGLWEKVNPMVAASIFAFRLQPQAFYNWLHPLAELMLNAQPNPAHRALADLQNMGLLKAIITQNVDNLHQEAGSTMVYELHGHLREATCMRCHKIVPARSLIERFIADAQVPRCECGGVMKPNVVLFGEQLPVDVLMAAQREAEACDLMLVAGSYLEVAPASGIPLLAKRRGSRIIIVNYQPTSLDPSADVVIHEDVAIVLPKIVELQAAQYGLDIPTPLFNKIEYTRKQIQHLARELLRQEGILPVLEAISQEEEGGIRDHTDKFTTKIQSKPCF